MLTKIDNISIHYIPHLFSKKGHVRLIRGKYFYNYPKLRLTREEFNLFTNEHGISPFRFITDNKIYWLFGGRFYKDSDGLDSDEVRALLLSRQRLKAERINRAKTITAAPKIETKSWRGAIPEDIRMLVWQRDGGRCVKCGSQSELQYDHIIPFSVGGASTHENLQILCGTCNRAKKTSVS